MELIEKPCLRAVHYLNSITYADFRTDCINDTINNGDKRPAEKDIKTWFSVLQQFCKTNIKTNGITKRIYSYSLNTKDAELGGRLFCGGSMQGLWNVYRGLLMRDIGTDIDEVNCHPVILRYICKKHGISCAELEYYINNRDECLDSFKTKNITRSRAKTMYLIATNSDKYIRNNAIKTDHYKKYEKEMKEIQKKLIEINEYKGLFETIEEYKKQRNYNGCAINKILCYYENKTIQHALHIINGKGIETAILMFDGLMVYGDFYDDAELLRNITDYVEEMMPTLNMKWAYKQHDLTLEIPDEFDENNYNNKKQEDKCDFVFKIIKPEFEKTHAKIKNRSCYVKETPDEVIVLSKSMIINAYDHMECGVNYLGLKESFINKWIYKNDSIRIYDDMGIYPDLKLCPKNMFNLWRPFNIDLFEGEYTEKKDEMDKLLFLIMVLCNHQKNVYDYILLWIAHMLQYPAKKSIVPTFISKQGAGKGTFLKILARLIGDKRVFETTSPSRDCWGDFNGIMANSFLVNLNELSRKETLESEGKIKGLITDPTLVINNKGVNQYRIQSYHRFINTTNNEQPIGTSDDDRRNLIVRCSDELINNSDYFIEVNGFINDDNVIRTIGAFFKNLTVKENFNEYSIPHTIYQDELKEVSKPYHELWLRDYAMENSKFEEIKLYPKEIFSLYSAWCFDNGLNTEGMNSIKLGLKLNNLFNPAVRKEYITTEENGKRRKTFFTKKIVKYYDLK